MIVCQRLDVAPLHVCLFPSHLLANVVSIRAILRQLVDALLLLCCLLAVALQLLQGPAGKIGGAVGGGY